MSFINSIISWLKDIEDHFYWAYQEVYDWVYPFWLLAYPLLNASRGFGWLAYYFSQFNTWLVWAEGELGDILSWSNIRSLIRGWLPNIEGIIDWWGRWEMWVRQEIEAWWASVESSVLGWITSATQGLDTLKSDWSNFWATIYPTSQ